MRAISTIVFLACSCLGFAQGSTSVLRGSVDIAITRAGTTTTTTYKDGAGNGTDLQGTNFGSFSIGDMVTLSDPYLFSSETGTCEVASASATVAIAPTLLPFLQQTIGTFPFTLQASCGGAGARFAAEGVPCNAGDEEWGDPTATITFDPAAQAAGLGLTGNFNIIVTWQIAFTGAGCVPSNNPRVATATGSVAAPLPVELLSFTAKESAAGVLLEWATTAETNNLGFDILRSRDGAAWEKIAFVAARKSEQPVRSYTYTDPAVAPGIHYYQLLQKDIKGPAEFSEKRSVEVSAAGPALVAFPNPATSFTVLSNRGSEALEVNLLDATGRQLRSIHLPAGAMTQVILDQLAAGTYILQSEEGVQQLLKH